MPIYDYQCARCLCVSEVLQKHTDPPPVCKPCDIAMIRQVGAPSFRLDGDGWAHDNYGLTTGAKNE